MPRHPADATAERVRTAPTPDLIHDLTLRSIAHNIHRQKAENDEEAFAYANRLALAIGTPPGDAGETAKRAVALWHQMYDEREFEKPAITHEDHYANAQAVLTHNGDAQLAGVYMLMALYEALILPGYGVSIGQDAEDRRHRERRS